jgi:hypothetical protein
MATGLRILVGNEPFSYREVHAEAFRLLRPDAEVVRVEPDELDAAVARLSPHLVVCSTMSEVVQTRPLSWILLYPDGANLAVVSIAGVQRTIPKVVFDDLLDAIDETTRRVAAGATAATWDHPAQQP